MTVPGSARASAALVDVVAELRRQAASPWAASGEAAVAMVRPNGGIVASEGAPPRYLASLGDVVAAVRSRFGDDLADGDLVVHNDPYSGGSALPDVSVVAVVGTGAGRRFGIARLRTLDVGGGEPGGVFPLARQVIQEGDRVPPVRIVECGRHLADLYRRLSINTRRRSAYVTDLEALGDAARRAAVAASEPDAAGEQAAVTRVTGEASASVVVASTLLQSQRALRVRVIGGPSGVVVDFDGTDAADPGPGNIPWAVTRGWTLAVLGSALGVPATGLGEEEASVRAPEGSLVRPTFPGACSAGGLYLGFAVRVVVARALARLGLGIDAGPLFSAGAVLSGPPAAEYPILVPLDCGGAVETLPDRVPGVVVDDLGAGSLGRLFRIGGPPERRLRVTTWSAATGDGAGVDLPAGLYRAPLPAEVVLPLG